MAKEFTVWVFALLFSIVVGHIVISFVIRRLRNKTKLPPGKNAGLLGCIERLTITIAWVLGYPNFIGVWLAMKMAGRWSVRGALTSYTKDDVDLTTAQINIFLIGNLLSVIFGVLGGLIIKVYLEK